MADEVAWQSAGYHPVVAPPPAALYRHTVGPVTRIEEIGGMPKLFWKVTPNVLAGLLGGAGAAWLLGGFGTVADFLMFLVFYLLFAFPLFLFGEYFWPRR
jgi:hypothetical protein